MQTVKNVVAELQKNMGKTVISEGVDWEEAPRLPTGVFPFDLATGGGFPRGRLSVVYGPESSMKTTLALLAIAHSQRTEPDKKCIFVDVESAYDPSWGEKLGVDNKKMIYVRPDYAEQAVDIIEALLYAEDAAVLVVDSLAALITQNEIKNSAETAVVGGSGLVIGKFYRKSTLALNKARGIGRYPALIAINQIRMKIGVMYGNPETMPGGNAVKFASSLTVRIYGKDEMDKKVSSALPAWKHIKGVIKKFKVPVLATNFEVKVATMPNPIVNLKVGQVYDWNTVYNYMKDVGMLVKQDKKGWLLMGNPYNTVDEIKDRYFKEVEFAATLKGLLIEEVKSKGAITPEGEEDAGPDPEAE